MDEQKLEKAARKYCELQGIDPDDRVSWAHPDHPTLGVSGPRWQSLVTEMKRWAITHEAIRSAGLLNEATCPTPSEGSSDE